MKKLVKIVVILAVSAFMLVSCNKYVCPAYTQADDNNTEQNS
jgi:PBP1b-binding outer membrane lipoprotein LpoB